MNNFIIIHGIGGYAGKHWQSWLKTELEKIGHKVIMPSFPNPEHPDRSMWLETLKSQINDIHIQNCIFVTHSLGAVTAMDFIEHTPELAHGFISVSGFARDYGLELNSYFLREKTIDMNLIRKNCKNFSVLYGKDDPYVPQSELEYLAKQLGVQPLTFEKGGHLNTDTGYTQFPQLLQECLRIANN